MILAKRDFFRNAFNGWRIDDVAAMGPQTWSALLQDASIVRNRKKIEACIVNARVIQGLQSEHKLLLQLVLQSAARRRSGASPEGAEGHVQVHRAGDSPHVAYGSGRIPTQP